jgi:hypothetical protein
MENPKPVPPDNEQDRKVDLSKSMNNEEFKPWAKRYKYAKSLGRRFLSVSSVLTQILWLIPLHLPHFFTSSPASQALS